MESRLSRRSRKGLSLVALRLPGLRTSIVAGTTDPEVLQARPVRNPPTQASSAWSPSATASSRPYGTRLGYCDIQALNQCLERSCGIQAGGNSYSTSQVQPAGTSSLRTGFPLPESVYILTFLDNGPLRRDMDIYFSLDNRGNALPLTSTGETGNDAAACSRSSPCRHASYGGAPCCSHVPAADELTPRARSFWSRAGRSPCRGVDPSLFSGGQPARRSAFCPSPMATALAVLALVSASAAQRTFTVKNNCPFTVWCAPRRDQLWI